jgi:hypothetical protein
MDDPVTLRVEQGHGVEPGAIDFGGILHGGAPSNKRKESASKRGDMASKNGSTPNWEID